MAGFALKIRGLSFMNMPARCPGYGIAAPGRRRRVLQGVKDQARRAFHQYARACVRSGREREFFASEADFDVTGSVGTTREVSG